MQWLSNIFSISFSREMSGIFFSSVHDSLVSKGTLKLTPLYTSGAIFLDPPPTLRCICTPFWPNMILLVCAGSAVAQYKAVLLWSCQWPPHQICKICWRDTWTPKDLFLMLKCRMNSRHNWIDIWEPAFYLNHILFYLNGETYWCDHLIGNLTIIMKK